MHCRLPYEAPSNRPMFQALFRYASQLGRRGVHRTAVEAKPYNFLYADVRRQKYYSSFTDELHVRRPADDEKNTASSTPTPTSAPTSAS